MSITLPSSSEAALTQLDNLGKLISATKWERAAIITALVGPALGQGRRTDTSVTLPKYRYSPATLAVLGITGLRSEKTIRYYRDQWCEHRPVPALGDIVELDGLPEWVGAGTDNRIKAQIKAEERASVTEPEPEAETPESLTYGPMRTHPPVALVPVDTETLATEQADSELRRLERAEETEAIRDEAEAHGDYSRSGMRVVPDEPDLPPSDDRRYLAHKAVVVPLVDAAAAIRLALAACDQIDHLHPSQREHFNRLVTDLTNLTGQLRLHRDTTIDTSVQ
jgi:hypothetical protein